MQYKVIPIKAGDEEFELAKMVRTTVFIKEQNVRPEEEYDEFEESSQHYIALSEGKPLGTCRYRKTEKGFKLERFAVMKEARRKGVATQLIEACLSDIPKGSMVYLHAQVSALPLYEANGFEKFGPLFYECEIPHYAMKLV